MKDILLHHLKTWTEDKFARYTLKVEDGDPAYYHPIGSDKIYHFVPGYVLAVYHGPPRYCFLGWIQHEEDSFIIDDMPNTISLIDLNNETDFNSFEDRKAAIRAYIEKEIV